LKDGKWATVSASEVEVGDIVLCKNEETFPADLVILASSSPDNVCYINTSSMDGEKNLKKRIIPKETGVPSGEVEYPTPDMITFIARCKADPPEPSLERFGGNLYPTNGEKFITLGIEQLLMNGT